MFEPLRFLHVVDANLDQPLVDKGERPAAVKDLALDATLLAFERVIDQAIAQEVDFVLLAGNTFCEADESLRARRLLVSGLRKLDDAKISLFVAAGETDPIEAWRRIPDLPGNVTLLTPGEMSAEDSAPPVAVLKNGRVVATIAAGDWHDLAQFETVSDERHSNGRAKPFRIGVLASPLGSISEPLPVACDYLAVRGSATTASTSLAAAGVYVHDPGPLQPRGFSEGVHGATMVEVDSHGGLETMRLPCGMVRRFRWELAVTSPLEINGIVETMSNLLQSKATWTGEEAWLVTWRLNGSWRNLDAEDIERFQTELRESLSVKLDDAAGVTIHHDFEFQETLDINTETGQLAQLYADALDASPADPQGTLLEAIEYLESPMLQNRLRPLAQDLDQAEILKQARAIGFEWFEEHAEQ